MPNGKHHVEESNSSFWQVRNGECPECGQSIRLKDYDKFLACHRCHNYVAGWPILRWVTHPTWITYYLKHPAIAVRDGVRLVVLVVVAVWVLSAFTPMVSLNMNTAPNTGDPTVPITNVTEPPEPNDTEPVGTDDGKTKKSHDEVDPRRVEDLILEYVNQKRANRRMPDLSYNQRAAEAARTHAQDMAEKDYFSHTSKDGETQRERYSFCRGGENAAKSWVDRRILRSDGSEVVYTNSTELAKGIVFQWMHSRPHRERGIYGPWQSAGAGVAIKENGEVYAVLGFCSR